MALRFTIIAHNVDHTLQIRRHGMFRNISRTRFPGGCHTLLRDHRLFANGTTIIKARQFSETMGMDGMATGQILGRLPRREHVFTADGTVVLVLVLEALVCIEDTDRDAHTTFIAVAEGFHSSHTTETTAVAMEGLLPLSFDIILTFE